MRRLLACGLAVLIVGISTLDPIYCADGCGRTGLTAANSAVSAAADCPFCSGVLIPTVAPFTAGVSGGSIPGLRIPTTILLLTTAIDPPPRTTA